MKKFKPMKIKNSSIRLPDDFLDHFLLNEGDFVALIEEDGKFYLRKTRETAEDHETEDVSENSSSTGEVPPKTFDEIMQEAQKQFANGGVPDDIMKTLQETLNDPEMMKKIQEMTMSFFKGFNPAPPAPSKDDSSSKNKKTKKSEDDEDNDDEGDGFKIDIE